MEEKIEERGRQFLKAIENLDQKWLADLLIFADEQELLEIKETLKSNKWILPRVCELGFLDVLQSINDFQLVDINTEYMEKTGLQYACKEGHVDVVTWLLDHGADLKNSLWKEDSEFYLATLNGKQDTVDILLSTRPELAPEMTVRYCLMYAACCGGHIELVKKWFAPGIDVREKIAFTSDLNNCEHKYPLFAACQGEHFKVAKFLIKECGAAITQGICKFFPEFTTKLVKSLFLIADTKHEFYFEMTNYKIECILPCWFSDEKIGLKTEDEEDAVEIKIDVKENRLRTLPDEVLWTLRGLVSLNASYNSLRTISCTLDTSLLALNQLKQLTFSHCDLESLSYHIFALPCLEQLNLSYNKLTTLGLNVENATTQHTDWKCTRLQSLDVSHNLLSSFPPGIQTCTELMTLNASYNQLTSACPPWQCPMTNLDLSQNQLTGFAPSADQFWKQTLKRLHLQRNQINELPESIVKMRHLTYLDVSSNKIQNLPRSDLWRCPLIFLNLNDNQLGTKKLKTSFQRVISLNSTPIPLLEFPKSCLASTMMELFIANNDLKTVPKGIGDMEQLSLLDLSENVEINELPFELGKLKNLLNLKLIGITLKDKELQILVTSLEDTTKNVFASHVINYLEKKRRNCVHPDCLKIVVLGCQSKNGPCIVQKLVNGKDVSSSDHMNLTVTRMSPKQKKSLTYEIWEFPDIKATYTILPCFLTLNSLYIIVHDVSYCGTDLYSVAEKVSSIQACVLRPKIIVACTYSKSIEKVTREKLEKEIAIKSQYGFPKANFVSVTLGAKGNVDPLLQEIYYAWETMNDAVFEKNVKLQKRQVPKTFVDVSNRVKKLEKNICRMDEFLQDIGCNRNDLEDAVDQNLKLHEFLLQDGAMLHYNIHMNELSDCVILNPTWLYNVFSKFLKSLTTFNNIKTAQLPIKDVRATIQKELPIGDYDYFPALLKLLENFNIGIRITDSANKKDELILVPSLLPKQQPYFQFDAHKDACKAARLYCLPAISPVLWSHVISQLILAFDRFSTSKWKLGAQLSNPSITLDRTKSFRMGLTTSLKGLNIYNKNIHYWRTGIMMHYDQGHVVVEQVACTSRSVKPEPGILVTVQTTGSLKCDSETDQFHENTKKLSVMGIIRDELDEILELFDPKFRDPSESHVRQIFALCPLCQDIKPGSGCVSLENIHFQVRDCAQALLSRDAMVCSKGPTSLSHLVPEFLFLELPPELHLSSKDVILSDVKLGHGMAGSVTKGTYKGTDVAVKVFHDSAFLLHSDSDDDDDDNLYPNVSLLDVAEPNTGFSRQKQDALETEKIKISNAFSEVRREVGILSKLRHEFIVTFIGICVRPQLLLVMELAPRGSLRNELERRTRSIYQELEHPDTVLTQMIFDKDLTYKIILQIGSGLSYLHKHNVVYRDLKPDNILVFSLSTDDRVNIKLSDYGISKFITLQGVTGLFGTVGYMAPEVVAKQTYTEQADIYSYAIVMLEVLTGLPPSEQLQRHKWSKMKGDKMPPSHIQGRIIHSNFPNLESLMKECWDFAMKERPTAENIVKRMKADQFLLLHDSVWLDKNCPEKLEVTCIYSCQTAERWTIWISESAYGNHRCFSVYDVSSCSFTIYRQHCHGPKVMDMTKVGSKIWLVCKELDNLQVIVRGTQNKIEVCNGVTLQAKATAILNHLFGTSEESEGVILVGLENGCVTVYHFNTSNKKSVTDITNIELCRDTPVARMCTVSSTMIAIACGMTIYFLHVALPDSQDTGVGKRNDTFIPELINCGSVSLKHILSMYDPVVSMVPEGNAVWCSLENSSCLVKVDVDNKIIVQVLTLCWSPSKDTVILEEKNDKLDSKIRHVEPRVFESQKGDQKINLDQRSKNVNDNAFSEASSNKTKRNFYLEPVQVLRHSDESSDHYREGYCETISEDGKPPVPPRSNPILRRRTSSLPEHNTQKKPPVPKRALCQEVHITISSLGLSVDNLVVGTSIGGIILLPLIYMHHSNTSGSLPTLPFHVPMLRHPTKLIEPELQSKSFTAISSEQALISKGSISALALTNDKLVSLHSAPRQILRDYSKSSNSEDSKRKGSVFTEQSSEQTFSPCFSMDETAASNIDHADLTCSGSDLCLPRKQILAGEIKSEVANIAVWDNLTLGRLKTVRSYGHEVYKCFGWCCHAPDRVSKFVVDDEMF